MKHKVKHHYFEWSFIGAAIVLGTMACSLSLPDISNLPRLIVLAASFGIAFLCTAKLKSLCIPLTIGTVSFLLFILHAMASVAWAINKGEAVYDVARWIMAGAFFLLVYNLFYCHPAHTTVMLARVSVIIILTSVVVAIWQVLQLNDFRWDNRYSITSLYTHKGTFSQLMLLVTMPIVMRLKLHIGRERALYWIMLLIVGVTLAFLSARTVLLAVVFMVFVMLVLLVPMKEIKRFWRLPAIFVITIMLGVTIVGGSRFFANTLNGHTPGTMGGVLSSASIMERGALWNTTFRLSDKYPLVGVGAGNWKICYPEVSTADIFSVDVLDFSFVRPHNEYLRILSEFGYLGLALFFIALASLVVHSIGRTSRHGRQGNIAKIAFVYLMAVLVMALVDFPYDRTELLLWCSIVFAVLSATVIPQNANKHIKIYPMAFPLIAIAVLAGIRIHCERQYPLIVEANHNRMWSTVKQTAHSAQSPLCNITPVGTPYAYYEAIAREQLGEQAIETYAEAIRCCPYHKQSLNDMARLLYTSNHDVDSAISLFKKAIQISPSFSYAYFNLAQLYLQEDDKDLARLTLLSLDLDAKQKRIDKYVWFYHTGETAKYYSEKLVMAERQYRDQMMSHLGN